MKERNDIRMSLPSLRIIVELATRCSEDDAWEDVELLPYRKLRNSKIKYGDSLLNNMLNDLDFGHFQ